MTVSIHTPHQNFMSVSIQQTKQTTISCCNLWLEQWRLQRKRWFDFQIRCLKKEIENNVDEWSLWQQFHKWYE